ncbi:MAG: hypothetical protein ACIAXF_08200, partial [Phycisphaerales bacterium JB063]
LLPGCDDGGGVTDATDAGLTAQEGEIASAVQAMLAREGNAMVRITDADGRRYLMLELEQGQIAATVIHEWLEPTQIPVAREAFLDAGATAEQMASAGEMFPEFTVTLPGDPKTVARFAADLLEQVYALPPQEELILETEDDE